MKAFKFLFVLYLCSFSVICSAINVDVKLESGKKVEGLGFTANGKKHGGIGKSYHGKNMPAGEYVFGVRKFRKNITCYSKENTKSFHLTKDTLAKLNLNQNHCSVLVADGN